MSPSKKLALAQRTPFFLAFFTHGDRITALNTVSLQIISLTFHVSLRFFLQILMPCSTGTARQNKFVWTYVIELSKLYRMVLELWESVQGKQFVPPFSRPAFIAAYKMGAAKRLPRSSWMSPGYRFEINKRPKSCSTSWSLFGIVKVKCS